MSDMLTVMLPGGWWNEGERHREVTLRPLVGEDEVILAEARETLLPVQWTTQLIDRSIVRIGSGTAVPPDAVGAMTIGDREALLLHIRRLNLGDGMQCALHCLNGDCEERLDLELKVDDLLLPAYGERPHWHETMIEDGSTGYLVDFRLPTGDDQEAASLVADDGIEAAADLLIGRCIRTVTIGATVLQEGDDWPRAVLDSLPENMSALDPQAEMSLNMTCPACGTKFVSLFDTADFLRGELVAQVDTVYREVHVLATCYHWEEQAIMRMSRARRRIYLNLCTELPSREQGT